jgi:ferredoxin
MGCSVRVDPDICISTGNCVRAAPEAFAFDDDDVSTPQPGAAGLSVERLVQIARGCPVGAIHVLGEDGGEIDPYSP